MLISYQEKFVFTKTKKTAGTSVESLFEPYCMEPGTWKKVHHTTERISEYGVVGYRGESGDKAYWWNHLSAAIIHERIGETEIGRFRSWLRLGGSITDRDCYMIDGEVCLDYFIRFEDLANGIEHVYEHLEIDSSAYQIPEFKSGYRNSQVAIKDYYDEETEAIVRERFGWELRYFGYDLPK